MGKKCLLYFYLCGKKLLVSALMLVAAVITTKQPALDMPQTSLLCFM